MIQLDAAPLTKGFHGLGHVWCASGRRGSRLESLEMKGFFQVVQGLKAATTACNKHTMIVKKKKKIMIDQATTTGQGRGEENWTWSRRSQKELHLQ